MGTTAENQPMTLLEQLAKAKLDRAVALEGKIEERRLINELNYVQSDRYLTDEIAVQDNASLKLITDPLDAISNKHFTRYGEVNFGHQANALIGALRTVLLQKKLGFLALDEACLMNTELSALEDEECIIIIHKELAVFRDLVGEHAVGFVDAIGRNTYFDKLTGTIVHGLVGDAVEAKAILEKLSRALGLIDPDFSQITQAKFNFIEERSVIKAHQAQEDNLLLTPSNDANASIDDLTVFKSA